MYFINLLIIIRIELNLSFVIKFFDLNNFIIKSIVIEFYSLFNILINLIYLYDEYLIILFR